MEKLRFEFIVKALATEGKTNVITITSIETEDKEIFNMLPEFENIAYHEKLKNTAAFKKVKATLTKKGTLRRVLITLNTDTLKEYTDEDGNIHFHGYLLEEQEKYLQTNKFF